MNVQALLSQLDALGVKLSARGDKLHCRAPDGVMTPELKSRLSDSKTEVLAILQPGGHSQTISLADAKNHDGRVVSRAEHRYWTLEQMAWGDGAYNMALPYAVRGSLDTGVLQRSIEQLVNRHQVLRSRFPLTDSGPVRLLDAPVPHLEQIDLRENKTGKQAHMDRVLWAPFDLAEGPLLRFAVLHEAADRSILLFSIHHIIFDGASFRLFCDELAHFYRCMINPADLELPELPVQYADFAHWENKHFEGDWLIRDLDYWKQQLEPVPAALNLSRRAPGKMTGPRHGARCDLRVSAEDLAAVRMFARAQSASVYMVMLSVFDILLWQLSTQREFILGVPVSTRNHPELERLIGNFSNTLALRQTLHEEESFRSLLDRVRDTTLDAYQHNELPIEVLVSQLRLEHLGQASNFLSVLFDLQSTSLSAFQLWGVETVGLRSEKGATMLDFSLVLVPEGDELQGAIEYNTGKFDSAEVEAAADHFLVLLRAAMSNPEQSLLELPSISQVTLPPEPNSASAIIAEGEEARYVTAGTNLEFHLVKLWEDLLGCDHIGLHDNFFERGGHSLLALRLMQRVEDLTGKRLSIDFLWQEEPTIERMAQALSSNNDVPDWRRAVPIQVGGDRPPLFVVHTMAGHLYRYYELAKCLAPNQPVFGLNARGVYGKDQPHSDLVKIATDCITSMRMQQPEGPYHIAGECMAGTTAYEMACQLTEQGQTVGFIGLLESYARGVSARRPLRAAVYELRAYENLYMFQESVYHFVLSRLGLQHRRQFRKLSEAQRWANWGYTPRAYSGRVDVFAAKASQRGCGDDTLNWGPVENLHVQTHTMPGDHGLMMEPPYVLSVAQAIQSILDEYQAGPQA